MRLPRVTSLRLWGTALIACPVAIVVLGVACGRDKPYWSRAGLAGGVPLLAGILPSRGALTPPTS